MQTGKTEALKLLADGAGHTLSKGRLDVRASNPLETHELISRRTFRHEAIEPDRIHSALA